MIIQIKNKIERELPRLLCRAENRFGMSGFSPLISKEIKAFALGKGKRLRPLLLVLAYKGYAGSEPAGLYGAAVSFELLHDFLIIHDDIIDKSSVRRGRRSLHKKLDDYIKKRRGAKFSGSDLAIVVGDILYALAIDSFLSVRASAARKERALEQFIRGAVLTGIGEGSELLYTLKGIARVSKKDIETVYGLKTAHYSFAMPLSIGASLAGAPEKEAGRLFKAGLSVGRAFQMRDDILGMFGDEKDTGKSSLTDLKEGKLTLLVWHAFRASSGKEKLAIKRLLGKRNAKTRDLNALREILTRRGSLEYVRGEIGRSVKKAESLLARSAMSRKYKRILADYLRGFFT